MKYYYICATVLWILSGASAHAAYQGCTMRLNDGKLITNYSRDAGYSCGDYINHRDGVIIDGPGAVIDPGPFGNRSDQANGRALIQQQILVNPIIIETPHHPQIKEINKPTVVTPSAVAQPNDSHKQASGQPKGNFTSGALSCFTSQCKR